MELIPHGVEHGFEHAFEHDDSSPEALYRAEKARRTINTDDAVMAEAKKLYDEAIAETGKKRAGMRSPVVPAGARQPRSGGADPVDPTVDSAESEVAPSGTYEADA